jgi:hypothetical protein
MAMKRNWTVLLVAAAVLAGASSAWATHNPHLGRFMQRDPLGYPDGMNGYQYEGSEPVSQADPDGRRKVKVGVLAGWYKKELKNALGQARVCFKLVASECSCYEDVEHWTIGEVNLLVKLAITLDPEKDTSHSKDGVYGHEQRHVKMMRAAITRYREHLEKKLGLLEAHEFKTEGACQKGRKKLLDLDGRYYSGFARMLSVIAGGARTAKQRTMFPWAPRKGHQRGFWHATTDKEEEMGHPRDKTEYDPSRPAGESKGDGLPLKRKDGWICSSPHD